MVYALHFRVFGPITAGAVDTTGLTNNVSVTTVPGLSAISGNGFYCARSYEVITTSVATTTELPQFVINYTDADTGVAQSTTINAGNVGSPGAVGAINGTYSGTPVASFCFQAQSGTAIQYSTTSYSSTPGGLTYALHIRVVGPITTNPVDVTAQTGNISATNVPGLSSLGSAGYYCTVGYEVVTTAASVSSTTPYIVMGYTDNDSNTSKTSYIASSESGSPQTVGTAYGTENSSPATPGGFCFYAKSGTAITYSTNSYASSAAGMAYALHIRVIGPAQF
jgi:hypothetical protein